MSKVVAAINMTIDGIFDHTVLSPREEIHEHYAELIRNSGALLYGSTTFQLMKYWRDTFREGAIVLYYEPKASES